MEKKWKKNIFSVSCLMIVIFLLGTSLSVTGPYTDLPANQQHWGFGDGEDMPYDEDVGTAWFVSTGGDGTDGLSWATAFLTIQQAVDCVMDNAGDYIYVKHGWYPEYVLTRGKSNFHIVGEHAEGEGVSGSETSLFQIRIEGGRSESIEITGLRFIDGIYSVETEVNGIFIHDNVFQQCLFGISFLSVPGHENIITENNFEDCQVAISIQGGDMDRLEISNNIFFRCGIGISVLGDWTLSASVITNNIFSGIRWIGEVAIPVQILGINRGNTIAGNYFGFEGEYWDKWRPIEHLAPGFNSYIDNHWSNWKTRTDFDITLFDGNEHLLISGAQTPTEGTVTIRILWEDEPLGSWASPGDNVTIRVKDTNGNLLSKEMYTFGVDETILQVEAILMGGEIFDVTVQVSTGGASTDETINCYILDTTT